MKANTYKKKSYKKLWVTLAIIAVLSLTAINFILVYINDYYKANEKALAALESSDGVEVVVDENHSVTFIPKHITAGLIFYPGGKVEYTAYAPLMHELADNGILCILLHMPGNLAVLDADAADGYAGQYSNVTDWYIGGHSLGGVMAASYAAKHADAFGGVILLASYSTADLSDLGLAVLSVYGSEDGVLKLDKYVDNRKHLPADAVEEVIDGGCHAYFGSYGAQDGDGVPRITNEEQIHTTVDYVKNFVNLHESSGGQ